MKVFYKFEPNLSIFWNDLLFKKESMHFQGITLSKLFCVPSEWGWSGVAKVSCILHYQWVQLILAYSWARLAILVADKGLSLFTLPLGDDTKWLTRVDVSLNLNTINQSIKTPFGKGSLPRNSKSRSTGCAQHDPTVWLGCKTSLQTKTACRLIWMFVAFTSQTVSFHRMWLILCGCLFAGFCVY